ncbi:MAG: phospholipase D family protein [Chitinophagaceae bacterium]|uniref:phospholipase D family protein n=1 Tax=Microcystis sp. M18BS1 TaxID=2771179 RepID=UPI002584DC5E|nr:phospholipase D family protein [Microcystis sp. M18BS1]MCA2608770.1 phospholipase D family protein [Microcystis sp. M27BS1]MCA6453811.1 phospholipase D family protein [Chitinophagaceae bacterium]MCA2639886.1 phospholipase D family protein [Microcystis sp. M18BS1]MCA6460143.1 phospholipase D family protein [Chitinophagaceae bacterium]MCA6464033.1 phospholipase D family protein [Chitinophagaceae bacterium]
MATFLTGNDLNAQLENLFEYADEYIILISPYIKLHDRYASVLKAKKDNPNFKIIVVFGKNEDDFSKSIKQEDFNFFKDFPNIEIRYEKRLHAKYYANESSAILTSMNLYNFSQDNNIEAGVLTNKKGVLGSLTSQDTLENDAAGYFQRVIEQSDLLFLKQPKFESTMLGLSRHYINSVIETDKLSDFFNNKIKGGSSFKNEIFIPKQPTSKMGFCIRTGAQILFNPKLPMCDTAFQSWKKFSNNEYPEKYCHFSGEPSNGETSFSKPILRKNWAKAKEIHQL